MLLRWPACRKVCRNGGGSKDRRELAGTSTESRTCRLQELAAQKYDTWSVGQGNYRTLQRATGHEQQQHQSVASRSGKQPIAAAAILIKYTDVFCRRNTSFHILQQQCMLHDMHLKAACCTGPQQHTQIRCCPAVTAGGSIHHPAVCRILPMQC
jgi:hypothetical protein